MGKNIKLKGKMTKKKEKLYISVFIHFFTVYIDIYRYIHIYIYIKKQKVNTYRHVIPYLHSFLLSTEHKTTYSKEHDAVSHLQTMKDKTNICFNKKSNYI